MQTVVELALEFPLELRMIEVAGMKFEVVGMDRNRGTLEIDNDFHCLILGTGGKNQQRGAVALAPNDARVALTAFSGLGVLISRTPFRVLSPQVYSYLRAYMGSSLAA